MLRGHIKLIGNRLRRFLSSSACCEGMMSLRTIGANMKRLLVALFALSLAGCADKSDFARQEPIKLAAPTGHVLSPIKSMPRKSLAARAEASHANESTNNPLMRQAHSIGSELPNANPVTAVTARIRHGPKLIG